MVQTEERIARMVSRYGKPFKTDRNGTMYFADYVCSRCGGEGGREQWKFTGFTCYECGGSGISSNPEVIKLYTEEYEAKLEARRQKAEAKRIAKLEAEADSKRAEWLLDHQFTADGNTFMFLGNTFEMKEAIKATGARFEVHLGWHIDHEIEGFSFLKVNINEIAEKTYWGYEIIKDMQEERTKASKLLNDEPESQWFGQEGDKVDMVVKYRRSASFEVQCYGRSWMTETKYIHTFTDNAGHTFCWKTTSFPEMEEGQEVHLKGTVKDLTEYKGTKQTNLTRCRITA